MPRTSSILFLLTLIQDFQHRQQPAAKKSFRASPSCSIIKCYTTTLVVCLVRTMVFHGSLRDAERSDNSWVSRPTLPGACLPDFLLSRVIFLSTAFRSSVSWSTASRTSHCLVRRFGRTNGCKHGEQCFELLSCFFFSCHLIF